MDAEYIYWYIDEVTRSWVEAHLEREDANDTNHKPLLKMTTDVELLTALRDSLTTLIKEMTSDTHQAELHQRHVVDVRCAVNYEAYGPCSGEMWVAFIPQRAEHSQFAFVCDTHQPLLQRIWPHALGWQKMKEVKS